LSNIALILNDQLRVPLSKDQVDISLDFSFENFSPNPQLLEDITINALCTNDEFDIVNFVENWVNDKGIQNGIPAKLLDDTLGDLLVDGLVNLPKSTFNNNRGQWTLLIEQFNNTFLERADGFKLRELYQNSSVNSNLQYTVSDFKTVYYVLNAVPDTSQTVVLLLSLYVVSKEVIQAQKELAKAIADAFGGITGGFVAAAKIAAAAVYFGAVVFATANLLKQLSDVLFQKPVPLYTISIKTLLEKAVNYLGYDFETDLFKDGYENLVILPSTTNTKAEKDKVPSSPLNNPIPNKTLLEMFNEVATMFNAKIKVSGNKVEFRNKFDFIGSPSNVFLADLKEKGDQSFNLNELPQSITLQFSKDPIETNTYLRSGLLGINLTNKPVSSQGNELQVTYDVQVLEQKLSVLTEKIEVNIPYARGYRKNEQTSLEKLFNTIYDIAKTLSSIVPGTKSKLGSNPFKTGDRIGALLLNTDFIGASKVFCLGNDNKLTTDSWELVHCETLYDRFYDKESPLNNQQVIVNGRDEQPICNTNDILKIKENNVIFDSDGNTIIVQDNKRDAFTGLHEISYRRQLQSGDFGFIPADRFTVNKFDEI